MLQSFWINFLTLHGECQDDYSVRKTQLFTNLSKYSSFLYNTFYETSLGLDHVRMLVSIQTFLVNLENSSDQVALGNAKTTFRTRSIWISIARQELLRWTVQLLDIFAMIWEQWRTRDRFYVKEYLEVFSSRSSF